MHISSFIHRTTVGREFYLLPNTRYLWRVVYLAYLPPAHLLPRFTVICATETVLITVSVPTGYSDFTVASPSSSQIVTRRRAALLAEIVHNFDELPFSNSELPLNIDIAQGFYQIPTSSRHRSTPPSSDSDSDSDSDFFPAYTYQSNMPSAFSTILDDTVTYAKWKPSGNGMPGSMSCGKITVETLELVKRDLRIFLTNNRKLAPSDYMTRCLNVWEDPRVSNWIDQNRDEFAKLDFEKFFLVLRGRVLEHDWQDSTFRKMCAVRMPDSLSTSVSDLAVQLLVLNNLLQGTPRFQSEENLKIMLIDATNSHLREAYNKEVEDHAANPAHGIHSKDFDTFTKAIQVLDNSRHRQLLLARQMAEHMIKSRPGSRAATPLSSSSAANTQSRHGGTIGGTSSHSGRLPPLTTNERRLLSENEGCFKCRSFFVKCRTSSNEHEFPLPVGNGYKEVMMSNVDSARKLRGPAIDSNKKARTGPIATITVVDENNNDDMVASIIPSAVLGNGTDSEEE
ncbi:uncharacterized protein C8R40DRAFT_1178713, partial [Lentinula edodes]|uniref:uncharacterized protein n=1 Tax=Lentinula edodes TaxID=5353 RepID=UPI001E8D1B1C